MLRLPRINPNGNQWIVETVTDSPKYWSARPIVPQPASLIVTFGGQPSQNDTFILGANTYTADGTGAFGFAIGATASITAENFYNAIVANDSANYIVSIYGNVVTIKTRNVGDTATFISGTDYTNNLTNVTDNGPQTGNNGALAVIANGDNINFTIDGTTTNFDFGAQPWGAADDVSIVANDLSVALGISVTVTVDNRLQLDTGNLSKDSFISVAYVSPVDNPYFNEGVSIGKQANEPASDKPDDTFIRLWNPTDPYFYRYDNITFIDLAENDKDLYQEIIAIRDGYSIKDGSVLPTQRFRALNGYIFETDVTFRGNFIIENDTFVKSVNILQVTDLTITTNSGETGSGVTSGDQTSGLVVDRGQLTDAYFKWKELSQRWEFSPSVIAGENGGTLSVDSVLHGLKTITEQEQVSIGDGVSTIGTFTDSNLATSLTNAIGLLPNGGKIYIKRGNYILTSNISIPQKITIIGEGASTYIDCQGGSIQVDSDSTITDIYLDTTASPPTQLMQITGTGNIIERVRFNGNTTDVNITSVKDNLVFGCISTTTTTKLP